MNAHVLAHALRTGRVGLAWYLAAAALVVLSGGLGFEAIRGQQASLEGLVQNLPPAVRQAFQLGAATFANPVSYVVARALSLLWPLLAVAFAAGGAGGVAALVERGTVHYELSLPLARARWLASRLGAGVLGLLVVVAVTVAVLYAVVGAPWWRFGVVGLAFGWLWLGVAYAVAAFARERGTVTGLVFGLFGVQFLLTTFARVLPDRLGWLENLSIWSAYRPEATVVEGVPWGTVAVWVAIGAAGVALALWRWRERDLPA